MRSVLRVPGRVRPSAAPRPVRAIAVAAALAAAAALTPAVPAAAQPRGATADADSVALEAARWRLRSLDGDVVTLGAMRGRPVVLNFWATWCPPCVAELPTLQALHDSLAAEGVIVALVSPERPATVRPVLARRGVSAPAFVEAAPVPASLGVRALPTTVVLDAAGRVLLVRRGAADWDTPAVRAWLRAVRDGAPAAVPSLAPAAQPAERR